MKHWICDQVPAWELCAAYLLTFVVIIALGFPRRFAGYEGGNLEVTLVFVVDALILAAIIANFVILGVGSVRLRRWYDQSPRFQSWAMGIVFTGLACFAVYSLLFNFDALMAFLKSEITHAWNDPFVRFLMWGIGIFWVAMIVLAMLPHRRRLRSRQK